MTTPKDRPTRRQVDARRGQREQVEENRTWRAKCVAAAEKAREQLAKKRAEKKAARTETEPPPPEPTYLVQHHGEPRAIRRIRQLDRGKVIDPTTHRPRWTQIPPSTNTPYRNPARAARKASS